MNAQRVRLEARKTKIARRLMLGTALCGLLTLLSLAPAQFGFGQPEKKANAAGKPGLKGILPEEAPDDLAFEAFESLGKDWAKWSEAVTGNLTKLYGGEKSNAASQRAVIASLRDQLKTADNAIERGRRSKDINNLVALTSRIRRRVDIAASVLDTLEADPKAYREEALKGAWAGLTTAIAGLESHLQGYSGGAAWGKYVHLDEIRKAIKAGNASAPILATIAAKIGSRNKLKAKAARDFLSAPAFVNLQNALKTVGRVSAKPVTVNTAALRAELKRFVAALESYEAASLATAASAARTSYDKISTLAGDSGAALGSTMQTHYFNYNFRVYASEAFINRLISDRRVERSGIRDTVLGARVYGNQITTTNTRIDLKPSRADARFDIRLSGSTRSSTVGVTDMAKVYVQGNHGFWVTKEIHFDGERLWSNRRARISVSANNRATGARTSMSWIPILGGMANNIAVSQANSRRGQSQALVRQKISNKVLPRFRKEIREKLAEANADLKNKVAKNIEKAGIKPDVFSVRSTNNLLLYNSRVMTASEFGGAPSNPTDAPGWGLTVKVHESAMNNAFDRLNLAGRTLTRDELTDEIEKSLSDILGKKPVPPAPGKVPKAKDQDKFVFDSADPIRFRIRNGMLNIIIRAGLRPVGKQAIPTQVVTVPVKFTVVGDGLVLQRGTVLVAPAKKPDNAAEQIVRAGIMRKKIQDSIPNKKFKRTMSIKPGTGKSITLTVTEISTVNGWVTVWIK